MKIFFGTRCRNFVSRTQALLTLLVICMALLTHPNLATCTTSATQETHFVKTSFTVSGSRADLDLYIVDVVEDSSNNMYQIGRYDWTNRLFVRKVDSMNIEQWFVSYAVSSPYFGSSSVDGNVLSIGLSDSNGYYHLAQINTTDGSIPAFFSSPTNSVRTMTSLERIVNTMGHSPSNHYIFTVGRDEANSSSIRVARQYLNSPTTMISFKFADDFYEYWPWGIVASSDTDVFLIGVIPNTTEADTVIVSSADLSTNPPTWNWGTAITTNTNGFSQSMPLALSADNLELVAAMTANTKMLIATYSASTGAVNGKVLITNSVSTSKFFPTAVQYVDQRYIYCTSFQDSVSWITVIDTNDYSGVSYTAPGIRFWGVSSILNGNRMWVSGGYAANNTVEYLNGLNSTMISVSYTIDTNLTHAQITDSSYDEYSKSFTFGTQWSLSITGVANETADFDDTTNVVDSTYTVNIQTSATAQSFEEDTTSNSFTPETTCIEGSGVTIPTPTYSLVAGSGSVPSYVSIDSSTAEITFDAPSSAATESFAVRTTYSDIGTYDTTISLTITESSAGGSSGGSSGSGSGSGTGSGSGSGSGSSSGGGSNSGTTEEEEGEEDDGFFTPAIIGIFVAATVVLAVVIVVVIILCVKAGAAKTVTTGANAAASTVKVGAADNGVAHEGGTMEVVDLEPYTI
jgi:hypothetical protein